MKAAIREKESVYPNKQRYMIDIENISFGPFNKQQLKAMKRAIEKKDFQKRAA